MPKWIPVTFDNIFLNFRLDQITVLTLYCNAIFFLFFFFAGDVGRDCGKGRVRWLGLRLGFRQ